MCSSDLLAEAQSQYRQRGKGMLFDNGQGYPLTYNPDTSFLLNGTNPALEGKITYSKDADGELIAPKIMAAALQSPDGGTASYFFPRPGQTVPVRKMFFARKFAPWNMTMSYGLYVDDLDADVNALLIRLGSIGVGVMALMGLLSWLIARDILGALRRQQGRMQRIANGALDEVVGETERGDLIGRMAETLSSIARLKSDLPASPALAGRCACPGGRLSL